MYSDESIAETLSAQAEVLAGGVLGVNFKKNEKMYNSANSEVYKMLQEQANEPEEPGIFWNYFIFQKKKKQQIFYIQEIRQSE